MRALLVVALAACSSKSSAPAPAKGSAQPPVPAPVKPEPLDFADDIKHVQMWHVVGQKGDFEIQWHGAPYHAQSTCRVEVYNLVFIDSAHDAMNAAPGDHAAIYRADPFVISPKICELRFYDDKHALQAAACFRDGQLARGMCDHDVWAVPKLPEGMTVDVQGASVSLTNSGGIAIKALITVGKQVDKNTDFSLVCDGVKSKPDPGEGFVPLSQLDAGETLFTWQLAFFMEKPLNALPKQCELTVTNKTKLGTFCIHDGSTESGRCES
jgi:hypothetical protein